MDTLVLNGKTYVRASKAARNLGYTSDYVGQLCRGGHVDAHLVGRTWYVQEDELSQHRVEKKRVARVKAREQAHKTLEEYRLKAVPKTQNTYKKLAIRYEPDPGELIPQIQKKLSVTSTITKAVPIAEEVPAYQIENEGKKVRMSGTINVIDAEEEEKYEGFTVLSPKVIKRKKVKETTMSQVVIGADVPVSISGTPDLRGGFEGDQSVLENTQAGEGDHLTFEERLKLAEVATTRESTDSEEGESLTGSLVPEVIPSSGAKPVQFEVQERSGGHAVWHIFLVLVVLLASGASVCLEARVTANSSSYETVYGIETESVLSKIDLKI